MKFNTIPMKNLLTLTILLLAVLTSTAGEKKVNSKIKDVTVFLSGAQVNREGSVTVPRGQSELIFTGISPLLKRESLQAGSKSNITIISVHYETKYHEKKKPSGDLGKLESQKNELQRKLTRLQAKIQVIGTEEAMIEGLSRVQGQKKDFTIDDIVKAKAVISEQLEAIKLKRISTQEEINTINKEINKVSQKIAAFGVSYSKLEPRIVVKIKSEKEQKVRMRISYFVANARWYPTYNLRVKNLDSPLVVDYQANISQQTGENWKNVKLTLSTNDPNLGGQKPKLTPWYLVLNQYVQKYNQNNKSRYTPTQFTHVRGRVTDQYGDGLPFANVSVIGSTVGTITDADGYYNLNLPHGRRQVQVSYIGYNTVNFNVSQEMHNVVLAEKYLSLEEVTVVSDMKLYNEVEMSASGSSPATLNVTSADIYDSRDLIDIAQTESITMSTVKAKKSGRSIGNKSVTQTATRSVPLQVTKKENVVSAEFEVDEVFTVPSDSKHYTVSIEEIEKKAHYQYYCAPKLDKDAFLTAQLVDWEDMNLLEGQANIFFEGTYVGSSLLDVNFVGDTLDISLGRDKRIIIEREKEKEFSKNKILGDKATKSIKWNISIKNNKKSNINLIVEDQFPLTKDARIVIDRDDVSKAKVDDITGFITWDMKIGGGKSEEITFRYKVTYPKGNEVYLE